jgi:multiple sugar transport system substrate-binding protein
MTLLPRRLMAAAATAALLAAAPALAQPSDVVLLSTQLRPVDTATAFRNVVLRDSPVRTVFVGEEAEPMVTRLAAELKAGSRTVSVIGAVHGEILPLVPMGALEPLDALVAKLGDRGIPPALMDAARLGTGNVLYMPWMQATYIMVADKRALPFLPAGADLNALTYDQLAQWGRNLMERTGRRQIGFPAGQRGLMNRFFQGYLYPAYTGGVVTPFRSAEAEKMWTDFKALWATVNPGSTNYDMMQDPLLGDEVWVAWDHVARVIEALKAAPDRFVTFPAPSGPKGRAYMAVVAGLGIVKGAPNRAGAEALIDYLTRPATQLAVAREFAFFPTISAPLPTDLQAGVKLVAQGVDKTQTAKDAVVVPLPIGLGAKSGEFSKAYMDAFTRIVLRNEPIRAVLDSEGEKLRAVMQSAAAPCWAPDKASTGACPVD